MSNFKVGDHVYTAFFDMEGEERIITITEFEVIDVSIEGCFKLKHPFDTEKDNFLNDWWEKEDEDLFFYSKAEAVIDALSMMLSETVVENISFEKGRERTTKRINQIYKTGHLDFHVGDIVHASSIYFDDVDRDFHYCIGASKVTDKTEDGTITLQCGDLFPQKVPVEEQDEFCYLEEEEVLREFSQFLKELLFDQRKFEEPIRK